MNQLLQKSQSVRSNSGTDYRVCEFLGGGGQGEVYVAEAGASKKALKWYFPNVATADQKATLNRLVQKGPPDERFLWPEDLVEDPAIAGFGYAMPLRPSGYHGITDLMRAVVAPSYRALTEAAYQLVDCYYSLHSRGYCYRDINFGNVFFNPSSGEVLICDNDNVAFVSDENPASVLGTPRFMAPEVFTGDSKPNVETDLYSLAVLLFYMFVVHHPLEGRAESEIKCFDINAMNRLYGTHPVFIFDPATDANRPDPNFHRNAELYWPNYPRFLQRTFIRAFTAGLKDPQARVRESEWKADIARLNTSISHCGACGEEYFFDLELAKEGTLLVCDSCRKPLNSPIRMKLDGHKEILVLAKDTQLREHHLVSSATLDQRDAVATVIQHPKDPTRLGLQNLTDSTWQYEKENGKSGDVEPQRALSLDANAKVNFETTNAQIRVT